MRVLILHTLAPERAGEGRTADEFDLTAAAAGVVAALGAAWPGTPAVGVRGEVREVLAALADHRPDVVFNLCEAPLGRPDLEAHVPALLEWAGVPFTGCGSETIALCRRKDRVTAVLAAGGVPVPRAGTFPALVKPADEDGSAGLFTDSICDDPAAVARALARLRGRALVQEFLPGREFAVALWGPGEPEHVSIGETTFEAGLRLITYAAKWETGSAEFAHTPMNYQTVIDPGLRATVVASAQSAWRAVGARGYLRVDLRQDAAGVPRVIDVNPNCELSPGVGICRAAAEVGWTWERFVRAQVEWARGG